MTLDEYQKEAWQYITPETDNDLYMLLGLQEEVGEFSGKLAKALRSGSGSILHSDFVSRTRGEDKAHFYHELQMEAGDILWMVSGLCRRMGWSLEDVAKANLLKIADRQARGVIEGNGDDR